MTAVSASPPWPAPPAPGGLRWHFGQEVWLAGPDGQRRALQWLLKRNCSITPRQLGTVYLGLCVASLGIALLFLWHGAPLVLAFAGVELLVVGLALLVFARHAGDRETLWLDGRSLRVEQRVGPRIWHTDFAAEWLAVEPVAGQGSLLELSGQGQAVRIGRYLRPELRSAFARELRQALRRASIQSPLPADPTLASLAPRT